MKFVMSFIVFVYDNQSMSDYLRSLCG